MTYIVTQKAAPPESEDDGKLSDEELSRLLEYGAASNAMMETGKNTREAVDQAASDGLIQGYEDIAQLNREQAKGLDEAQRGRALLQGMNGLVEGRTLAAVHFALERDPNFGPSWWKDDKKFARFLRDFPEARTYNRRG